MANGIYRIHEKTFRLVSNDSQDVSFSDLQLKSKRIAIDQKSPNPCHKNIYKAKQRWIYGGLCTQRDKYALKPSKVCVVKVK